jgi:hypothetical protein
MRALLLILLLSLPLLAGCTVSPETDRNLRSFARSMADDLPRSNPGTTCLTTGRVQQCQ